MDTTVTMRVGAWILEWKPARPNTVWAIPERLKGFKRSDSGILYDDGTMAWDFPDSTPPYVRSVAPQFVRKCQGKRVAK
jgi:hypothetical protein